MRHLPGARPDLSLPGDGRRLEPERCLQALLHRPHRQGRKPRSCAATSKIEGCNGATKVYSYNGPSLPDDVAEDPGAKADGAGERDQAAFAKPQAKGDEPKTLVELTSRAMSASRQRWRDTFGDTPEPPQSVAPDARTALPPPGQSPTLHSRRASDADSECAAGRAWSAARSTGQRVKRRPRIPALPSAAPPAPPIGACARFSSIAAAATGDAARRRA